MSFLVEGRLRLWSGALIVLYLVLVGRFLADASAAPRRTDFAQFWAAAVVARDEGAAAVYDLDRLGAAERRLMGSDFPTLPFNYPPTYLALVLPLGLLPLLVAWCVWTAAGVTVFVWAMCRAAPHRLTPWLSLAFPGVILNVSYGQNGLFLAAVVAAGWSALGTWPLAAGLLLSFLAVKPHLALAVPLALAACRRWRALAGFCGGVVLMAAVTTAVLGAHAWVDFARRVAATQRYVDANPVLLSIHSSVGSSLRLLGLPPVVVAAGRALAFLAAGVGVMAVACRRQASLEVTGAAAVAGGLLMAPYLLEYDLALLAPAVGWLTLRGGAWWSGAAPRVLLVLCWLLPFAGRHTATLTGLSPAPLLAALLLAGCLLCLGAPTCPSPCGAGSRESRSA